MASSVQKFLLTFLFALCCVGGLACLTNSGFLDIDMSWKSVDGVEEILFQDTIEFDCQQCPIEFEAIAAIAEQKDIGSALWVLEELSDKIDDACCIVRPAALPEFVPKTDFTPINNAQILPIGALERPSNFPLMRIMSLEEIVARALATPDVSLWPVDTFHFEQPEAASVCKAPVVSDSAPVQPVTRLRTVLTTLLKVLFRVYVALYSLMAIIYSSLTVYVAFFADTRTLCYGLTAFAEFEDPEESENEGHDDEEDDDSGFDADDESSTELEVVSSETDVSMEEVSHSHA